MDEAVLEIREHRGQGYESLIRSGSWRVAILRFEPGLGPEEQTSMERHVETDEVFVLTQGRGLLILGGNASGVSTLSVQPMDIGKVYNIKRNAWHTVCLSRDASVLIVENADTGNGNSEYAELSQEQRRRLLSLTHC